MEVWAGHSSRTHHACQGRHTERPDQATLICHNCGTIENADKNASKMIAQRTVIYIKEKAFADQAKSRKNEGDRAQEKGGETPPLVYELASV